MPTSARLLRLYEKKRGDRRTGSSKWGSVGEAFFFGVFLLFGVGFFVGLLFSIVIPEWRANRQFISTDCKVLAKSLGESRGDDGDTYRPDIRIEYHVNGARHEVVTWDAARFYTSGKAKAEKTLAQFEVGKTYPCWYDPLKPDSAVLVRGYSGWFYLFLLVPLAFIVIGGGGLIFTALHWGTSAERRAALTQRANVDLLADPIEAMNRYPNVPGDDDVKSSPGTQLAYRLPIVTSPGWALFGAFLACLFWNGIVSIFVVIAVRSHLNGNPEWFLTVFIIPFVLVGLALVGFVVRQLLIATGIGPTRLEISQHPLSPGDRCEVLLSQEGKLSMNSIELILACDEHATYRQGTDTRTDTRRVSEQSIYRRDNFTIERAFPLQESFTISVPEGAMHSFKSDHNEVRWKLVVKGDVAGWPNYEREYRIVVYPPRAAEVDL